MRQFVFWTGLSSLVAGAAVQIPAVFDYLRTSERPGMLLRLFGAMAIFLGIMLAICSRDLKRRGSIVIWEGILRVCGFGILTGYWLFGGRGKMSAIFGVCDLIVGTDRPVLRLLHRCRRRVCANRLSIVDSDLHVAP